MIDHIASASSLLFNVKELVRICRNYGVEEIFVDGAHAPGQVDLNVSEMDVDYYCGNLHKWNYAPTGCCLLYVRDRGRKARMKHPIVTADDGKGLLSAAGFIGTKDYSSWFTAPAAIEFTNTLGPAKIKAYCHELVWAAGQMLAEAWSTEVGQPKACTANMVMVSLPHEMENPVAVRRILFDSFRIQVQFPVLASKFKPPKESSNSLEDDLTEFEDEIVQTLFEEDTPKLWLRISANIYNEMRDYIALKDAVLEIVGRKPSSHL